MSILSIGKAKRSDNATTLPEMNLLVELILLASKDKKRLGQALSEVAPEERAVLHQVFEKIATRLASK